MESSLKCQALILKVASRCNLNCTYCYMYNLGDTTYLLQPKRMSSQVVEVLLEKVRTHCLHHQLKRFEFIFHGGEPLLLDKEFYRDFVAKALRVLQPQIKPFFSLQTNATLLTDEWCQLFEELNISLGISLDGTPFINNKFRVDHQGQGSYEAIVQGLRTVQKSAYTKRAPGILCVIDVSSDPLEVYEHFKALAIQKISFLLPYATHDTPPPGFGDSSNPTPYADWLLAIFDQWFEEKAPKPKIRFFEQILELILGIDRGFEYLGARHLEMLVIETDGGIEAVGALKVCGNGFTKAGMNVLQHELDEALATDLSKLYHLSHRKLAPACTQCPIVQVCGGGFLPHRYSQQNQFLNPSVFCLDLMKLITHVQNKLLELLPANLRLETNLAPISFEEIKSLLTLNTSPKKIVYEQ